MIQFTLSAGLVWPIVAFSTAGVLFKPFRLAEAWWPCAGAILLMLTGQLAFKEVDRAVVKGLDVYLFLIGMMLVAELARTTGLFDWLAAKAVRYANGSVSRLFVIVYLVGIVVTIFMSNDATAVVLTPAVLAATKTARVERPLPHLLACALIANAASFVLPVSNPANLVVFANKMPDLMTWFHLFLIPSIIAIFFTFIVLYYLQRDALAGYMKVDVAIPVLTTEAKFVAGGIALMAVSLMTASAVGIDLGTPTFIAGIVTFAAVFLRARCLAQKAVKEMSWAVLPLVAGLFILVAALSKIGVAQYLAILLRQLHEISPQWSVWAAGAGTAFVSNIANNLPAGLLAGATMEASQSPPQVIAATLIGIDIGPNLSVTGSLATVLWITSLRREGIDVSFTQFLKVGCIVMPVSLFFCLAYVAMI